MGVTRSVATRPRRRYLRRLFVKRLLTAMETVALVVLPLTPSAQASLPRASTPTESVDATANVAASDAGAAAVETGSDRQQLAQLAGSGGRRNRKGGSSQDDSAPAVFRADEVDYDQELSLVVARGHVEIDQAGRILLADTVTYNQKTDTVTASGNISMLEVNGDIMFADYIELTQNMREAFVSNVRILMVDKSRVAGNTGRRTEGGRTELRRGVYSPCQLCATDPTKPPTWQIMGETIVHDQAAKRIEYRDAVVEFGGVPLLYSPYFSHPDPTVKRASGLLVPAFGNSQTLGVWTSLPYYAVLDVDKDLTFEPIFTSKQGVVAAGEYRQRFDDGRFNLRFSLTNSDRVNELDPTGESLSTSKNIIRGHVLSSGIWDLDDENRIGFDIRRATDQTYLRRYHFGGTDDYLTSHAYLENFDRRNYGSVDAYAFESQRVSVVDRSLPYVLPSARYSFVSEPNSFGAKLMLDENFLNIVREQGNNTTRATSALAWSLPFTSSLGDVMSLTPRVMVQGYNVNNYARLSQTPAASSSLNPTLDQTLLTPTFVQPNSGSGVDATLGRVFPQVELSWRHPFVRRGEEESDIIEPIVAFFSAPRGNNDVRIPNEDSLGFEFNDSSLFVANRFPGLDRVDGGTRVDYGVHAAIYTDTVYRSDFLLGQSYRFTGPEHFAVGSGLEKNLSDVVGRATLLPADELSLTYRFRLNGRSLASRRQEVVSTFGPSRIKFSVGYVNLRGDVGGAQLDREQATGGLRISLSEHWILSASSGQTLKGGGSLLSSFGSVTYTDDCLTFTTTAGYSRTSDADVLQGTSVTFSLILKNIGVVALPSLKA